MTEKVTYDDLSGTVHVGDKVGSVMLKQDGTKIAVMDLVADEEGSGPNPIEWLLVKLDRLGRRIDNRPLTAESETIAKAPRCRAGGTLHLRLERRPTGRLFLNTS